MAAQPLIAGGKVYVPNHDGIRVYALRKDLELIAHHEFDSNIKAPPVFADGVLYVLTFEKLYAIAGTR